MMIFVFIITTSCRNTTGDLLDRANSIIEDCPDSSLTILKTIDSSKLTSYQQAMYALLYTQAEVKTGIDVLSDSLIRIAHTRFHGNLHSDLGVRSDFYMGEIFFNQGKFTDAMPLYLSAYENSKCISNFYWQGKSAERIADLFFYAYNYTEAERFRLSAIEGYKKSNKDKNLQYALADLASIYLNNHKEKKAIEIFDSLYSRSSNDKPIDFNLNTYIRLSMIEALLISNRINEITEQDIQLLYQPQSENEQVDFAILLNKLKESGYNSISHHYNLHSVFESVTTPKNRLRLYYALYKEAKNNNETVKLTTYADSILNIQNSVVEEVLNQSITSAQRDYYKQSSQEQQRYSSHLKTLIVFSVLLCFTIILLIIAWYKLKIHKKEFIVRKKVEALKLLQEEKEMIKRRLDIDNEKIANLENLINQQTELFDSYKKESNHKFRAYEQSHEEILENLFRNSWKHLDMLLDEFYKNDDTPFGNTLTLKNISVEIQNICSKKGLEDIVSSVDKYMNGLVTSLKNECPFLKENDINFLSLLFAGFSSRAVCALLDLKQGNFYTKKKRLIDRIENSDAPHKTDFINKLNH